MYHDIYFMNNDIISITSIYLYQLYDDVYGMINDVVCIMCIICIFSYVSPTDMRIHTHAHTVTHTHIYKLTFSTYVHLCAVLELAKK